MWQSNQYTIETLEDEVVIIVTNELTLLAAKAVLYARVEMNERANTLKLLASKVESCFLEVVI